MANTDLSVDEHLERGTKIAERQAAIEQEHDVKFEFDYDSNSLMAEGLQENINAALAVMQPRAEFIEAIKLRQPAPKRKRVKVRLAAEVPSLAVQKANYRRWFSQKSPYYHPTEVQLETMFAACEEGWEILPDFAHSFTARRPDGSLISINRKGKIEAPSIYSPHLPKEIEDEG